MMISSRAAHPYRMLAVLVALPLAPLIPAGLAGQAGAAKSDGCENGGYQFVNLTTGAVVASGDVDATISAAALGTNRFGVRGPPGPGYR